MNRQTTIPTDRIEKVIGPAEVASLIGRSVACARRLMKDGSIRSWVDRETEDRRQFRVTIPSEVAAYQRRSLESAEYREEKQTAARRTRAMTFEQIWT